jgi:transcriptional regulator with XRE-family HTH domain
MWKSLADKAYRHAYGAAHVGDYLAMQVHSMRARRGWTQKQLADESGNTQPQISNFETSCEGVTLTSLHKLAAAFDVALIVKFVPFSLMVNETLGSRADSVVPSFEEDSPDAIMTSSISIQLDTPRHKNGRKGTSTVPYLSQFQTTGSAALVS